MMLRDYVANLEFDRMESYRIDVYRGILSLERDGQIEAYDRAGSRLPNGLVGEDRRLHPLAALVCSVKDAGIMAAFRSMLGEGEDNRVQNERLLITNGLLMFAGDRLVGGLNIVSVHKKRGPKPS